MLLPMIYRETLDAPMNPRRLASLTYAVEFTQARASEYPGFYMQPNMSTLTTCSKGPVSKTQKKMYLHR